MDEAAEARLWLRLTVDSDVTTNPNAAALLTEATELEAILSRSYGTAKANLHRKITKLPDHQITKSSSNSPTSFPPK